jgi:hypothetical protein
VAANIWKADRGTFFYVAFAWVAVIAAGVGFSTTYWLPVVRRTFAGPLVAHIHGMLFFGWIALLIAQVHFARAKKIRIHQRLGNLSPPLALTMAMSGIGVGMMAVRRDLAAGMTEPSPYSQLVGVVFAMLALLAFVGAAYATRKTPDRHKRFMLLATVAVWWPAWFRWRHLMPGVPDPELWLGFIVPDSMILIAALRDRLKFGRVHPVYWWFGGLLIAEHLIETMSFDTPAWRSLAKGMFGLLDAIGY